MRKINWKERGITLVTLVVTIIVLLILAGTAISLTLGDDGIFKKAKDAVDKYRKAAEQEKNMLYNLESDMEDAIGEEIPVKTEKQLLKIGSGEKVEVDGVDYFYNSGRNYVLENNIETNTEYEKIAELVKNKEVAIIGNGNQIIVTREDGKKAYYTEDSKFYIAVNKYGYVLDGLQLYYDGIDNSGEGKHDNNTLIWKDLSGNNNDGILNNFGTSSISGWHNNYLSFDGINDWVNCGEQNYPNVTLEAAYVNKTGSYKEFFGNWESGGNGLLIKDGLYQSNIYTNNQYYYLETNTNGEINKRLTQSMTYDGKEQALYINGEKKANIEVTGDIKSPINNTVMAIGTNATGSEISIGVSDIDVYSVRIYNRGLTEEEIEVNGIADGRRFKGEEIIGISSEEELLNVESGKIYELKNDIEVNGDYTSIINKLNNKEVEIKSNEYKIINNGKYYMSNSKYTIAVNKYGYVIDGLELLLDGKDNEGTGKHNSSTTVWKDLSGNSNDGTLMNMDIGNSWSEEGLNFDGIDDYVPIAEMNYDNVTLEAVTTFKELDDEAEVIIGNQEASGYYLYRIASSKKLSFGIYLSDAYSYAPSNYQLEVIENKKYYLSGAYDGNKVSASTSMGTYQELNVTGTLKDSTGTSIMLGANPKGTTAQGHYLNGIIHVVRMYSKALSDEERAVNYANDKERYKLSDLT